MAVAKIGSSAGRLAAWDLKSCEESFCFFVLLDVGLFLVSISLSLIFFLHHVISYCFHRLLACSVISVIFFCHGWMLGFRCILSGLLLFGVFISVGLLVFTLNWVGFRMGLFIVFILLGLWLVSVVGLVFLDLWLYGAFISMDIDVAGVFPYTTGYELAFYFVFACLGRQQPQSGDVHPR
jgi:hypothetical protein